MCGDARVESRIAQVLSGSGLPMDRRSEIAEELRGHLQQSIASKRDAAMSDEQAVEAVLVEFGSPDVIRRQLCRRQRAMDRREALNEVRRQIWLPLAFAGLFSVLAAALTPEADGSQMRWIGGAGVFTGLFALMVGFMYAGALFSCRARRLRPRAEFRFATSCLRWMAIVALGFAALVPMLLLELAACAPLLGKSPLADHVVSLLWHNFGVAWLESAPRNFGLCALGVLGFGLALAVYERSRCVDEPPVAAT